MITNHLRFKELLRLSVRTFRIKPVRALLTILGMSVGIGTVLFLVSLGYGLQYILIGKLITTEDSLITMEVSYPTESNLVIKKESLAELRAYPDVSEVSPIANFPGEISVEGNSGLLVDTLIVEPAYFRLTGLVAGVGRVPNSEEKATLLSSQTFLPIGLKPDASSLGKQTSLKIFYDDESTEATATQGGASPAVLVPIVGILTDETMQPSAIVYKSLLSVDPPYYRKALVKALSIEVVEKLRDRLLEQGFIVSARIDLVNQARKITNIITVVLGVFGITALVVSAIGMFNTMIVGFMERTYEVGILKSIGATDSDVRNLFLMESLIMGFCGGLGGVLIGVGAGKFFNLLLSTLSTRMGGENLSLFITPWWFILLIMGLSLIIGLLSGFWPAYRAIKLSPKEAFSRR